MSETLQHRGPDASGLWTDAQCGVALAFRRLAIIDLTETGSQPMESASGQYVIVFNGEVYNFRELRLELESLGQRFRGTSDTEVLLAGIERWGLDAALGRVNGMFAFALWDRSQRTLHLARDRFGEKPLYYGWLGSSFVFGSELKALRVHPAWRGEINREALALYLRYRYVPTPWSIFCGIHKLPAATTIAVSLDHPRDTREPQAYWSFSEMAARAMKEPLEGSDTEITDQLETLLSKAVGLRMVADVPLGAFLSGGLDSSTIVALMQAQSRSPVQSFTIGFHRASYNEAEDAKAVARALGTDHVELYLTPTEAMAAIPRLPVLYDEPFADSSQIPTHLVAQMARQHVTVALSGDGGDELFAGYNRHLWAPNVWRRMGSIPRTSRAVAARLLTMVGPRQWDRVFETIETALPRRFRQRNPGEKLHKLASVLASSGMPELYDNLVSHWRNPAEVVIGGSGDTARFARWGFGVPAVDIARQIMFVDTLTYLPDDILTKVDRATMGASLEGRIPFLDHGVVEFAWRLPFSMKIRDGRSKWILRQVLSRYLPESLVDRPKMGFGVPIGDWLRGPLRDWAEALLDERRIRADGYLRPEPVRRKWSEHSSGSREWQYLLWDVLMFQAWLEEWQGGSSPRHDGGHLRR